MQETPEWEVRALLGHDPWPDVQLIQISKQCIHCGVEKLHDDFVKNPNMYFGVSGQCKACKNAGRRKGNVSEEKHEEGLQKQREYREKNPEVHRVSNAGWKKRNRKECLEGKKRYRTANREYCNAQVKAWHDAHREYLREYWREYGKYRRTYSQRCRKTTYLYGNGSQTYRRTIHTSVNVHVRINRSLRSRVRTFLKTGKLANELLGCDYANLKNWFELNFILDHEHGMNWQNYGTVWEIDHVRACVTFNMNVMKEYKRCFHWRNLAPVTIHHNRSKGGRIIHEDEKRQKIRLLIFEYMTKQQASNTALTQ